MKDVVDAISARIKTPYFGYAILALFALNWRGMFLLAVTEGTPQERLAAFDCVTSYYTLLVWPLAAGALVAVSAHWIQFLFGLIARKPSELIDNLHLVAEHNRTIRQTELEKSRSDLASVKEKEFIERAKRDEEVAGIEDEEAKKKLAAQLEEFRKERDDLSRQLKNQESFGEASAFTLSPEEREILKAASENKNGTILKPKSIGNRTVQVGNKSFGLESHREFAKYETALKNLVSKRLINTMGGKEKVFRMTHKGWEVADTL